MPGHHGSFQASQFPAFVYMRETIELLCDQATVTLTFLDTTTSVLKLILLLCCMYIEQLIFKLYSKTLLNLLSSCIIEFSMCTNMLSR